MATSPRDLSLSIAPRVRLDTVRVPRRGVAGGLNQHRDWLVLAAAALTCAGLAAAGAPNPVAIPRLAGAGVTALLVGWLFHRGLEVGPVSAGFGAAIFLFHPLVADLPLGAHPAALVFIAPLAGLSLLFVGGSPTAHGFRRAGNGLCVALLCVIDPAGGVIVALVSLAAEFGRRSATSHRTRGLRPFLSAALSIFGACGLGALAHHYGPAWIRSGAAIHGLPSTIGPLATVDRHGWLAVALADTPHSLVDGGRLYLGLSLIALACTALLLCPHSRGAALAWMVVLLLVWLIRGPASLHAQLKELFVEVTVRKNIANEIQNRIGLLIVPLLAMQLAGFRATQQVLASHRTPGFAATFAAATLMLILWCTAPTDWLASAAALCTVLRSAPSTPILMAGGLAAAAVVGSDALARRIATHSGRVAFAALLLLVGAFDLAPRAGWRSWHRRSPDSTPAAAHSEGPLPVSHEEGAPGRPLRACNGVTSVPVRPLRLFGGKNGGSGCNSPGSTTRSQVLRHGSPGRQAANGAFQA